MNIENPESKLHPHVYKLREEFAVNGRKVPEKFTQWFCLKEEKRLEYIKSHNLYPFWNSFVPEPRLFEEENNILRKLRQMEIENENNHNKPKPKEREKEKEKEKNDKDFMVLENNYPMNFELKTARKTGSTMNFVPMKNLEQKN